MTARCHIEWAEHFLRFEVWNPTWFFSKSPSWPNAVPWFTVDGGALLPLEALILQMLISWRKTTA